MLSPEYLAQLPEPLIKLWQLVEDDILRDIGRRIRKMDKLTDTAAYQIFRREQTKLLHTDIVKLIAKYSGKSETAIRKMLSEAAVETLRSEDAIHAAAGVALPPINESKNLNNLLNAGYQQTIGTWKNLTATTANTVTRQFEDALDRAWLQISSGAFDYQTAVKNAVDDLAQQLEGVTYPSGHHDTLEVAVRRAALTGVNQTCGKLQWERREQTGCEFVEVTAHSGARDTGSGPANHANWQGKVYHVGGAIWYEGVYYEDFVTATGYGTGAGLCGWNCRHNFCSFWPGISTRVYTDKQLAELSAKNIEYNGKMYSRYEINQMQRERERKVRKWKKTWMIEKEAGIDTTDSAVYLKNARKNLSDFAKATGGRVDSSRLATWDTSRQPFPGKRFGHSEATSATWDVRKADMLNDKRQISSTKSHKASTSPISKANSSNAEPALANTANTVIPLEVLNEYEQNATPGIGSIVFDDGYDKDKHANEIKAAEWLHATFGGNIQLLNESAVPGEKMPDYLWRTKMWELKNLSTAKAADTALRNALKQILRNPGGIILDYGDNNIAVEDVVTVVNSRMKRGKYSTADVMIVINGKPIKIIRYKK